MTNLPYWLNDDKTRDAFAKMQASSMNVWVGVGDVIEAGTHNVRALMEHCGTARNDLQVLDLGCGIGRTTLVLAKQFASGHVVGIDIVPAMVAFCHETVTPAASNTNFHALADDNPLYDKIAAAGLQHEDIVPQTYQWIGEYYRKSFDLACAFSVFTHTPVDKAHHAFALLQDVLRPGATLLITAFIDMPHELHKIYDTSSLAAGWYDPHHGEVCNYIVWTFDRLVGVAAAYGFTLRRFVVGNRNGNGTGDTSHPHDILVFTRR